jgi:micrococcal nuclease
LLKLGLNKTQTEKESLKISSRTSPFPQVFLFLLIAKISFSANFSAQVIGVSDGDTITVLHDARPEPMRLHGIDCPEKGQDLGARAKQLTSE